MVERSWAGLRVPGKRTRIIGLYPQPPAGATVICADELGPVIPRTFAPAPGWSPDGHRIKSEIDYSRGPEKTWVYGGLRVRDGQQITMAASSRNSVFYQQFLQLVEDGNPIGEIWIVTDNLSTTCPPTTACPPGPGWRTTLGSATRSSRSARAG
jgi:hypothetical protein